MGINIIKYADKVHIDITELTVTPETLAEGITATDATGSLIVGTAKIAAPEAASSENSGPGGINKVIFNGRVLFDVTMTTVTPETLLEGVTAIDAAGRIITGVARSCSSIVGEAIAGIAVVGHVPERCTSIAGEAITGIAVVGYVPET